MIKTTAASSDVRPVVAPRPSSPIARVDISALTHTGQGEINPLSDTITMAVTDATGDSDATPASIVISMPSGIARA